MARTNRERTEATRQALTEAARALFVSRGYAETSTPDVCAAAGITRGALYHHFADKRDLFRHVLAEEAAAVATDIEAATPAGQDPAEALLDGAQAYLQAMTVPGRTRLLLVEGPAVLGLREMLALDEANAARTLREGLDAAGVDAGGGVAPLLSAAFDRAALEIEAGADAGRVRDAMLWLLRRVLGQAGS
ncbi:putative TRANSCRIPTIONal REGULATOR, TetR family [Cupriavidus taiwanensis]|uniref:TetR/AcrR family transcriptional regulator n=1 Tax=Cupriavidus taiwanensis TaxID=164546 RepID=UPI000E193F61|nr:TetR/AcrR family transcriptional regulator [Cupriavidus taiwanensis]SOZ14842.1 putative TRANSCRIPTIONal REGULATOR, TetR family [Cupriavidus taiwanensis]SOZ26694.1 putative TRANSCRIPTIONal REGULATOR, TetR family [Cupriavidus taiwanensis]SOZ45417.1 putative TRANSCRIPTIONal REGULATOR, TetR family [Cupriavidus taiwanensis]